MIDTTPDTEDGHFKKWRYLLDEVPWLFEAPALYQDIVALVLETFNAWKAPAAE